MIDQILDARLFILGVMCGVFTFCIVPSWWAKFVHWASRLSYKPALDQIQADLHYLTAQMRKQGHSETLMDLSEKIDSLTHVVKQFPHVQSRTKKKSAPKTYVNGAGNSSKQTN